MSVISPAFMSYNIPTVNSHITMFKPLSMGHIPVFFIAVASTLSGFMLFFNTKYAIKAFSLHKQVTFIIEA